jgi:tryptophanyl-tRNA synthetase
MGFDDPTIKMSKSLGEIKAGHSIGLLDTPDMITRAIMSAVTDSQKEMRWERASRGVLNLLILYEALTGQSRQAIEAVFVDKDYAFLKKELLRVVLATLEPIQSRYRELMRDPAVVDDVLKKGAARVRPLAEQMMNKIKRAVGLV